MDRVRTYLNRTVLLLLVAAGALLLCSYVGLNLFRYTAGIDSDVAAEGLIARAMWEHGSIIPSEFYPSSETRILNVNLIAAGIYGLTGNMNLSMGMACSILMGIMILLYVVLLRRLCFRVMSVAAAVLLLLAAPVTIRHAQILYLYAEYYTIHSVLMLVTLMMWLRVAREGMHEGARGAYGAREGMHGELENHARGRMGWIMRTVVSSVLAFVISLSGLRAALVCYAPLLLTAGLEFAFDLWHKRVRIRAMVYTFVTMLCAYIATFMPTSIGVGTTRNIRKGASKLVQTVIPDMLESISLGEQDTVRTCLLMILLALVIVSIAMFVFTMVCHGHCDRVGANADGSDARRVMGDSLEQASRWSQLAERNDILGDRARILAFFIISLGTSMLMAAFTTTESVWRYYFMLYYVMSFAVGLLVDWCIASSDGRRNLTGGIVSMIVLMYAMLIWRSELLPTLRTPVYVREYEEIISYMQEHDYYYGYSTYATSNAMTGYCNGAVQISVVSDLGQMDICMWLTDKTWYGPYVAADTPTAYIIPISLEEEFAPMRESHEDIALVLETENYHVYASAVNYSWQ